MLYDFEGDPTVLTLANMNLVVSLIHCDSSRVLLLKLSLDHPSFLNKPIGATICAYVSSHFEI